MESVDLVHQLSSTLFWDVDIQGIDPVAHKDFIIPRVMDRGSHGDAVAVWAHYGADAVRESLLGAPSLERKTIHFFANQFGLDAQDFRAYRKSNKLGTWVH